METKDPLDQIPSRVKYYLLDWKDHNMDEYINVCGEHRLRDLSLDQLHDLFCYVTTKDRALLGKLI